MKYKESIIISSLFLIGLGFSVNAAACTTDGWDSVTGSGVAGSPSAVSRYSELCAFEIIDASYVQSIKASDTRYIARFYVLDGLTGSGDVEILEAYSNDVATTALFQIRFDGSQFTFDATDAGGTSGSTPSASGWNLVEVDWESGGSFKYWVNADANTDTETGSVNAGAGTVEAVNMGAPNGFGTQTGTLTFDAFESHRTLPVGALLVGDANGNGSVNIFDMIGMQNEILDPVNNLAIGQPDCNENGSVNVFDMICAQNIILSGN